MIWLILIVFLVLMLLSFFGAYSGYLPCHIGYGGGGVSLIVVIVLLVLLLQ